MAPDLFAIVAGAAVMLVWAGMVEAFVSQYHQPVIPYALKIAFGVCELIALTGFLGWAGRGMRPPRPPRRASRLPKAWSSRIELATPVARALAWAVRSPPSASRI